MIKILFDVKKKVLYPFDRYLDLVPVLRVPFYEARELVWNATYRKSKGFELVKRETGTMRPIYCVETDEVFSSVLDLGHHLGKAESTVHSILKGNREVDGKHYRYVPYGLNPKELTPIPGYETSYVVYNPTNSIFRVEYKRGAYIIKNPVTMHKHRNKFRVELWKDGKRRKVFVDQAIEASQKGKWRQYDDNKKRLLGVR